jgi:hypothetical protein
MWCVYAALSQTLQFVPTLFRQTWSLPAMSVPPWQDCIFCIPFLSSMSAKHKMICLQMTLPAEQFNFLVRYYYQIRAFASSGDVLCWLSLPWSIAIPTVNACHCHGLPPCFSLPHRAQECDLLSTIHLHDCQKLITCSWCPCTDCTTAFLCVLVQLTECVECSWCCPALNFWLSQCVDSISWSQFALSFHKQVLTISTCLATYSLLWLYSLIIVR